MTGEISNIFENAFKEEKTNQKSLTEKEDQV